MRIVAWEDRYRLGIDHIDSHHQHLLELLNRAYNAVIIEYNINDIRYIFHELLEYTDYHFKAEEELMHKFDYSKIDSHVLEHEVFRNRLNELLGSLLSLDSKFDIEIIYFLEEWLLNHISHVDKDFAVSVIAKGYKDESRKCSSFSS